MTRYPSSRLALAALTVWLGSQLGACEQEVVPVASATSSSGGGGAIGMTGGGDSGGGAVGGAGGVCGTPNPAPPLRDCSGSVSASTGGPSQCEWSVCDDRDGRWTALCTLDGCSCQYDDVEVCSCDFDPPLSVCDSIGNCCPAGWPRSP